jgi:hypothetical protein
MKIRQWSGGVILSLPLIGILWYGYTLLGWRVVILTCIALSTIGMIYLGLSMIMCPPGERRKRGNAHKE